MERLGQSLQEAMQNTPYPIVVASIEKGEKESRFRWQGWLHRKIRIPTAVTFGLLDDLQRSPYPATP